MAIVRKFKRKEAEGKLHPTETECTYTVFQGLDGEKILQIDTYGSANRKFPGKQSQTLQFSPEAIKQLKEIIRHELS